MLACDALAAQAAARQMGPFDETGPHALGALSRQVACRRWRVVFTAIGIQPVAPPEAVFLRALLPAGDQLLEALLDELRDQAGDIPAGDGGADLGNLDGPIFDEIDGEGNLGDGVAVMGGGGGDAGDDLAVPDAPTSDPRHSASSIDFFAVQVRWHLHALHGRTGTLAHGHTGTPQVHTPSAHRKCTPQVHTKSAHHKYTLHSGMAQVLDELERETYLHGELAARIGAALERAAALERIVLTDAAAGVLRQRIAGALQQGESLERATAAAVAAYHRQIVRRQVQQSTWDPSSNSTRKVSGVLRFMPFKHKDAEYLEYDLLSHVFRHVPTAKVCT